MVKGERLNNQGSIVVRSLTKNPLLTLSVSTLNFTHLRVQIYVNIWRPLKLRILHSFYIRRKRQHSKKFFFFMSRKNMFWFLVKLWMLFGVVTKRLDMYRDFHSYTDQIFVWICRYLIRVWLWYLCEVHIYSQKQEFSKIKMLSQDIKRNNSSEINYYMYISC